LERHFSSSTLAYEDISHTQNDEVPNIIYFAPSFDGQTQIAIVGIGKPNNRLDYSHGDLDLLSEVADQIGTIVSLSNGQPQFEQTFAQSEINENEASMVAGEMLDAMGSNPFVGLYCAGAVAARRQAGSESRLAHRARQGIAKDHRRFD
jgi:hypothetical protein